MNRKTFLSACLILVCAAPLAAAQKPATFSIMTQNMDSGTDLGYLLYGLTQPDPQIYVDLTFAEANASAPRVRALVLALEIAARKPHVVALQEVTLWRVGPTPETATAVWIDQLKALMAALGPLYKVVAVNT